jgi:membrane fusion protein (multidrug efflux system)
LESSLLATISPLDPMWFNATISEVQYLEATRWITPEEIRRWNERGESTRAARLVLADGSEHLHTGRFIFLDRAVDTKTGTLRIRAEFPNPEERLRPGLFGRLRTLLSTRTNAVLVPQRAVQEIQGAFTVFKLSTENKAVFTPVKPGERVGSLWIIDHGLTRDDVIIVEGLLRARDGAEVDPSVTNLSDAPVQQLLQLIPAQP